MLEKSRRGYSSVGQASAWYMTLQNRRNVVLPPMDDGALNLKLFLPGLAVARFQQALVKP